MGLYPYFLKSTGRFIYLKIDFRKAMAKIAHVYRGEKEVPFEFKLRNLSLMYVMDGHSEAKDVSQKSGKIHLYDTYNLRAYDDFGKRVDVRPGEPELVRLLRDPEHAVKFDYMQFVLNNYERFERE